jgi:hypothetical protein
MRGAIRPLTRLFAMTLIAGMATGAALPAAQALAVGKGATVHTAATHKAAVNPCGTYMVGHQGGAHGGGVITGTIVLTGYTACPSATTSGKFMALWAPPRPQQPKTTDAGTSGSGDKDGSTGNGKGKGHDGGTTGTAIVTPATVTITGTKVLTTTGTFVQDVAHPSNPKYVLVSGTAGVGQLGSACQANCPATGNTAPTRLVIFTSVPGTLAVHATGKTWKATLRFEVQVGTQINSSAPITRTVSLMGTLTKP